MPPPPPGLIPLPPPAITEVGGVGGVRWSRRQTKLPVTLLLTQVPPSFAHFWASDSARAGNGETSKARAMNTTIDLGILPPISGSAPLSLSDARPGSPALIGDDSRTAVELFLLFRLRGPESGGSEKVGMSAHGLDVNDKLADGLILDLPDKSGTILTTASAHRGNGLCALCS